MSENFNDTTILEYVIAHIDWSERTFGKGDHLEGLLKHIVKEVHEVRDAMQYAEYIREMKEGHSQEEYDNAKQEACKELTDIIILAIDAMWRLGFNQFDITRELQQKQRINMERKFPKITNPDEPTEHIRE